MTNLDPAKVAHLTGQFVDIVHRETTPAEFAEICRRNGTAEYAGSVCATHDFFDANEFMADAFRITFGRPVDLQSDDDTATWSAAWTAAKEGWLTPANGAAGLIDIAAEKPDIDDAVSDIQNALNVKTGDAAGVFFSGFDWPAASVDQRKDKLQQYIDIEVRYAAEDANTTPAPAAGIDAGQLHDHSAELFTAADNLLFSEARKLDYPKCVRELRRVVRKIRGS